MESKNIRLVQLAVEGMTCQACVGRVEKAISQFEGTSEVKVNLESGMATFLYNGLEENQIPQLVQQQSDKACKLVNISRPITFRVEGMTCNRCVQKVESVLNKDEQISNVQVSLQTGLATFFYSGCQEKTLALHVQKESGKNTTILDDQNQSSSQRLVTLCVEGMTCMGCVGRVKDVLNKFEQVSQAEVSLEKGIATFQYSGCDEQKIAINVEQETGKKTTVVQQQMVTQPHEVTLKIEGMTCNGCVKRVKESLNQFDVSDVQVSLESGLATFLYLGFDEQGIANAVQQGSGKQTSVVNHHTNQPRTITLKIVGMTCNGCVKRVEQALTKFDDASDVEVSLKSGLATFKYTGTNEQQIVNTVQEESGKVTSLVADDNQSRTVTLQIKGMTCQGCVGRVTQALEKFNTISDISVSLETGLATFSYTGSDEQVLVEAVKEGSGKETTLITENQVTNISPDLQHVNLDSPHKSPVDPVITADELRTLPPTLAKDNQLTTTQLRVGGMTCSSCVGMVEGVLCKIPGVSSAKVNLLAGRAAIVHDSVEVEAQELADAVSGSGYQSLVLDSRGPGNRHKDTNANIRFRIDFPTDLQAQHAVKTLRLVEGVEKVEVTECSAKISMTHSSSKSAVLRALEKEGSFGKLFIRQTLEDEREAIATGEDQKATDVIDEEAEMWRKRFFLSLSFFLPIVIVGLLHNHFSLLSMRMVQWIGFILATPIQFICGRGFYRASYYALKKRRATMDVLVALSTSIAYFSSVIVVVFDMGKADDMSLGHTAMFRVSAMIITMVLIGKWLETSAKKRAAAGVAALSALTPEDAVIFDEKDQATCFTEVPVKLLHVGDVVRLIAGDRVPVDGEVIEGASAIDESMLTGESRPVPKTIGDSVYGGTVNGGGAMLVRTTAVGSDAVLSQIVKLVNDAQTSRAPVEAFADRVSAVFVPAVVAISTLVFIIWYGLAVFEKIPAEWYQDEGKFFFALLFALETLVIACPCALGLATPTAVMVASEVGTKMGVLFRGGGAALEAATKIKTVLFDKTGTLTMGRPEVTAVMISEQGRKSVEQVSVILSDLVYIVESQSHHPLASAITKYIEERNSFVQSPGNRLPYKISNMEEVPGRGIMATINKDEYKIRIGVPSWAFGETPATNLLTNSEIEKIRKMEEEDGLTIVAAVVNDSIVCIYGLEDTIRPEAADVIDTLHSMNISTALVTGDSEESGRAVAVNAGISTCDVHARTLPWTKVSVVESKSPSCFVGDGINDAPALAAADVGIAIGTGAPTAAESASIVLVRADLQGVVNAIALAKATFRRVRLNFCWAIGYNLIGIPLAAGILYPFFQLRVPPFVASGAMALSSTSVVLSSLALRLFNAPKKAERSRSRNAEREMHSLRSRFVIDDDLESDTDGEDVKYSNKGETGTISPHGSSSTESIGTEDDYVPLLQRTPEIIIQR